MNNTRTVPMIGCIYDVSGLYPSTQLYVYKHLKIKSMVFCICNQQCWNFSCIILYLIRMQQHFAKLQGVFEVSYCSLIPGSPVLAPMPPTFLSLMTRYQRRTSYEIRPAESLTWHTRRFVILCVLHTHRHHIHPLLISKQIFLTYCKSSILSTMEPT